VQNNRISEKPSQIYRSKFEIGVFLHDTLIVPRFTFNLAKAIFVRWSMYYANRSGATSLVHCKFFQLPAKSGSSLSNPMSLREIADQSREQFQSKLMSHRHCYIILIHRCDSDILNHHRLHAIII
jgi:hypothetical protein